MDDTQLPVLVDAASLREEAIPTEFVELDPEAISALPTSEDLAAQIVEALKATSGEIDEAIDRAYAKAARYHNVRLESFWVREKLEPRLTVIRYDLELGRIPFHKARLPQTHRILEIFELNFRSTDKSRPLDILRREISDLIELADDSMDRRTAVRIRDAFDEVVSECIQENRLHITRHDYALNWLNAITEARRLNRYRAEYLAPRDPRDYAGKIIRRLATGRAGNRAEQFLLGPFPHGRYRVVTHVFERLRTLFENDRESWLAAKGLVLRRLLDAQSPESFEAAFSDYSDLLEIVFDPEELAVLKNGEFSSTLLDYGSRDPH